nr:ATP synthase F0 subunit 8 [Calliblepharis sp.]
MPQLDRIIIFSQIFWLLIVFAVLYAILTHFFLPLFLESLKSRKQIVEFNTSEIDKLSSKSFDKQVLLKKKILKNLSIIEKFLNNSQQVNKYLKKINKNIFIAEKISLASVNYLLYCNNFILKSILFYPNFFNFKV